MNNVSEIKQVITHNITLDEFKKLEIDDVNYQKKDFHNRSTG
jgi:hypothetical protein